MSYKITEQEIKKLYSLSKQEKNAKTEKALRYSDSTL